MSKEYKPIACSLHDSLESFCVKRTKVIIVHKDETGEELIDDSVIVDVLSENKEEFILLDNKRKIRLDRIVQVNEVAFKS